MNKEKLRKLIPDFARKVAPLYELLQWKWQPLEKGKVFIPDADEIAKILNMLLDDLREGGNPSMGGLTVYHDKKGGTLSMGFAVREFVWIR